MSDTSNTDSVARILALSALEGGQTDKTIVVQQAVGGIPAGKVYAEGTSMTTIINDLLSGTGPVTQVTIYYGATTNIPTGLEGLTSKQVGSDELLADYNLRIVAGDETLQVAQHPVIAIPDTYELTKWSVLNFPYNIPHTLVKSGEYNIYYLDVPSYDVDENPPGINYVFTIVAG